MKKTVLSFLSAALILGGCAGTETGLSKTQTGALIGGLAGAAAGAATGNHSAKRILIGGAIGAAAGGGIGYYMDKQEEELKKELQGSGVQIQRDGNNLTLNMPGGITFDTGKTNIKTNFNPVLNDIANVLVKYPDTHIDVQGHTDNVGNDADNLRLSELRAQSVVSALAQRGVPASRMKATGFGESMPIASNNTPQGREANRRVEIKIFPDSAK